MVKDTQTICRLLPKNCLSVFGHYVGLALTAATIIKRRNLEQNLKSKQSNEKLKIKFDVFHFSIISSCLVTSWN